MVGLVKGSGELDGRLPSPGGGLGLLKAFSTYQILHDRLHLTYSFSSLHQQNSQCRFEHPIAGPEVFLTKGMKILSLKETFFGFPASQATVVYNLVPQLLGAAGRLG